MKAKKLVVLIIIILIILIAMDFSYKYEYTTPSNINVDINVNTYNTTQNGIIYFNFTSVEQSILHLNYKIDGTTYINGLRIVYLGTNLSNIKQGNYEGPCGGSSGVVKYNLSLKHPDFNSKWNVTLCEGMKNGSFIYRTAPAGYYKICEGAGSSPILPDYMSPVFHIPTKIIKVSGIYSNYTLNNNTLNFTTFTFPNKKDININYSIYIFNDTMHNYTTINNIKTGTYESINVSKLNSSDKIEIYTIYNNLNLTIYKNY